MTPASKPAASSPEEHNRACLVDRCSHSRLGNFSPRCCGNSFRRRKDWHQGHHARDKAQHHDDRSQHQRHPVDDAPDVQGLAARKRLGVPEQRGDGDQQQHQGQA